MNTSLRGACAALIAAGLTVTPATAATRIFSIGACTPGPGGVCFGMPPAPSTIREMVVNVPAKGAVTVMVNGSGICQNASDQNPQLADFVVQIVDDDVTPIHTGPGGLLIRNMIPKAPTSNVASVVAFNLASHRVFTYSGPGQQTFKLRLRTRSLGPQVGCSAYSLNMTAVFNSQ